MLKAEIFENAAEIIKLRGWTTGPGLNETGPLCISNALSQAIYDMVPNRDDEVAEEYHDKLRQRFGFTYNTQVFQLNDTQPEDKGQKWAIGHLKAVAAEIKSAQVTTELK